MQARLEDVGSGLAPVTEGWFAVNVRDAAWLTNDAFGARCVFEAGVRVVRGTDFDPLPFAEVGIALAVLEPGKPSGLYHAESAQEDFLVLAGECVAVVEGEQRRLRAWDFLHCPAGTEHGFTGAGEGPCVLLMLGARPPGRGIRYPRSELAASAEVETDSPRDAYAGFPHWQRGRPPGGLPWG
jgi:uncharacterized cupin superfamily protein